MRKSLCALLLTLAITSFAHGFQTDAGWPRFSSDEGRFSVLTPCTPTTEVKNQDSPVGPYTIHSFICRAGNAIYWFGWVDYAPTFKFDVQAEINANRDNFIKGIGATVLAEKKLTLDGNPGIEFTAQSSDIQFIKSRVYIVGSRPYQLATVTNDKDEQVNVDKFLSSFTLTAGK